MWCQVRHLSLDQGIISTCASVSIPISVPILHAILFYDALKTASQMLLLLGMQAPHDRVITSPFAPVLSLSIPYEIDESSILQSVEVRVAVHD